MDKDAEQTPTKHK